MDRLLPDNIRNNWPLIKKAMSLSLPPVYRESEKLYNSVLDRLMDGSMQCWLEVENGELYNVVITELLQDLHNEESQLLLFTLTGFKEMTRQQWFNGYRALTAYAKSVGASRIVAYTDEPALVQRIQSFGGNARFYLSLEVN